MVSAMHISYYIIVSVSYTQQCIKPCACLSSALQHCSTRFTHHNALLEKHHHEPIQWSMFKHMLCSHRLH
jgi:hypothetical protein